MNHWSLPDLCFLWIHFYFMNYRKIWSSHYGPIPKDEKGRSYDIHHIDGNRNNNDITNLKAVSLEEHWKIHFEKGDYLEANMIADRIGKELYYGWKHKEETKKKISEANKGKKMSEKTRKKMSEWQKGRLLSQDHKKKISESLKGREFSEESRRKISESRKNKKPAPFSEETRRKMSESRRGKHRTEETKNKISESKSEIAQKKLECPHCKLIGGITNMKRYHFDNCRNKK